MTGLILLSHGSLLCGSSETVRRHAERIQKSGEFDTVEIAFMNYSQPPLREAVARCIEFGATRIVVVPYLLVPGKFTLEDVPEQLALAKAANPNVQFFAADPVGFHPLLSNAVIELTHAARPMSQWGMIAAAAGDQCAKSRRCPLNSEGGCTASELADQLSADEVVHERPEIQAGDEKSALLMIAHGSPREEANKPILEVAGDIRAKGFFHDVSVAYLECNQPDIPDGLTMAHESGATRFIVFPYFLHAGKHVARDIPQLVKQWACLNRDNVLITDYLGQSEALTEVLKLRGIEALQQMEQVNEVTR
jgi:sirohydrochlorin ferrochelatase